MEEAKTPDAVWAVVELLGHRKLAGRLTEEERFGSKMGRLDIPTEEGGFVTQYFGGGSVYAIMLVSEEAARIVAKKNDPAPVHSWEIPKQLVGPHAHMNQKPYDDSDLEDRGDEE